jgi:tetratricopeptide (TPR) repeat protein
MDGNEEKETGFEGIGERIERLKDENLFDNTTKQRAVTEEPVQPNEIHESAQEPPANNYSEKPESQIPSKPSSNTGRNIFLVIVGFFIIAIFYSKNENPQKSSQREKPSNNITTEAVPTEQYYPSKEWDELLNLAVQWEQRQSNNPVPSIYKCLSYNNLGKYDAAITSCGNAVNINANIPETYFLLGYAHLGLRDKETALRMYKKLTKLNPDLAKKLYSFIPKSQKATSNSIADTSIRNKYSKKENGYNA